VAKFVPSFLEGTCGDKRKPITFGSVTCKTCDGNPCQARDFSYEIKGGELVVKNAPAYALVEYSFYYDSGCGQKTVECSAYEVGGDETMFGWTANELERKRINAVDSSHWGWYQVDPSFDPTDNVYEFTMYAGAGQNDLDKGIEVGTVVVTVETCIENEYWWRQPTSSAEWLMGTDDLCVDHDLSQEHLHVGPDHPRNNKGKITYAPGRFKAGCCKPREKCYIAVHGVVTESSCSGYGSCAGV
jgi:hypothetical protein